MCFCKKGMHFCVGARTENNAPCDQPEIGVSPDAHQNLESSMPSVLTNKF